MIEIIKSVGIAGPDELLRCIRLQADGRLGPRAYGAGAGTAGADVRRVARPAGVESEILG